MAGNWFVNDGSTAGDVFTTAVGNDANPGTSALPFATIEFAIATAAPGDTIYVDAGTYTDASVDISKSVVLRGAKYGIPAGPAASPANRGTDESIIVGGVFFGPSIDNIAIDGFTVNTGTGLRGIQARGLNSTIINNIVTGIPTPLVQQAGISTRANGPLRLHSYLIRNNNVTGFRFGIYFDGNLENPSEISFNYVANCFTTGYVMTGSEGHLIKANVSVNNFQGMSIQRGNTTVIQNTIEGSAAIGIRLPGTAFTFGNVIQFNYIRNCALGIGLTDPNPAAINNQANYNSFTGNTANIGSEHAADFDASCNWYGTTDPAAIAASIGGTGPVTFVPFLTDGIDSDPLTDGFQPNTTCIVVPVVLTTFNGQVKNLSSLLTWETASEQNASHFIIERSIDNIRFDGIARVSARGFSNAPVSYHYTDSKPPVFNQPIYYRLRMVDLDGTFKFSRIVRLVIESKGSFVRQLFPNPATSGQIITLDYQSDIREDLQTTIISATGQTAWRKTYQVIDGLNRFTINLPSLNTGLYFLVLRKENGSTERIPVLIR